MSRVEADVHPLGPAAPLAREDPMEELLERIAQALERIAEAIESGEKWNLRDQDPAE